MNGVLRPDLANVVGIGLIAFVSIFLIDRGLRYVGKSQWTTSGS